jgi:glycosyltransferase involved in cell wall biosynthesis
MKVLIVDFDVSGVRGGGQTVYSKLISRLPERQFYFFTRRGSGGVTQVAHNVHAIGYGKHYHANASKLPPGIDKFYHRWVHACQFAASVKAALGPTHFDVVDVPDYTTDALFIRQALAMHGISVGVVALAMHGAISRAFDADWAPDRISREIFSEVVALEDLQFRLVDVRYAISDAYAELWGAATGLQPRMISPLHICGAFPAEDIEPTPKGGAPDLIFVGRRERGKGPDIFIDLAWAIDPSNYGRLEIIGGESSGPTGTPSLPILEKSLRLRKLEARIIESLPFDELEKLFRSRAIIVLPSRLDTFNLIALEALRLGCPVFVSREAGVSRWIETNYPELAELVIDLDCGREAAARIRHAAQNYDATRARIAAALAGRPLSPSHDDLALMYTPLASVDARLRSEYAALAELFQRSHPPFPLQQSRHNSDASPVTSVQTSDPSLQPEDNLQEVKATHLAVIGMYARAFTGNPDVVPTTSEELRGLIGILNEAIGMHRSARVDVFTRLGNLERVRGNLLTAALYDLRIMRWLGGDPFARLDDVQRVFRAEGFAHEAEVIDAMYRDPSAAHDRCLNIIRARYQRLLTIPERPWEILDDRRGTCSPKVSVIVSLYNTNKKLPTLLENLSIQTLAGHNAVEVILVDSGSPGNEYQVFREMAGRFGLPIVFARSQNRETIQSAWNRGILLSRAPYLCFYGVDEGMHPDCLATLASVLDARPHVDWVMADSVVTDVDQHGVFAGDMMEYNRYGLDRNIIYLDTTYLSWVGGLYRRSIHERFGYYDESFRAAGDTEFKARVLSQIQVLHVPKTLGVFNNYPEERTTAHPRAEIEDQRAWYLHRTTAGMANLLDAQPISAAEELFSRCFAYHKPCFRPRVSTDFDLAAALADYMMMRGDNPGFAAAAKAATTRLLKAVLRVESQDLHSPVQLREAGLSRTFEELECEQEQIEVTFGSGINPRLRLFNDNRYEQHWWSWSTA